MSSQLSQYEINPMLHMFKAGYRIMFWVAIMRSESSNSESFWITSQDTNNNIPLNYSFPILIWDNRNLLIVRVKVRFR